MRRLVYAAWTMGLVEHAHRLAFGGHFPTGVDPRLTFQGLRDSAVSILLNQGASLVELAAIMGRSRSTAAAMTMRYGHLFAGQEKRLTEAVEQACCETAW